MQVERQANRETHKHEDRSTFASVLALLGVKYLMVQMPRTVVICVAVGEKLCIYCISESKYRAVRAEYCIVCIPHNTAI